jgi:hypothetical protein
MCSTKVIGGYNPDIKNFQICKPRITKLLPNPTSGTRFIVPYQSKPNHEIYGHSFLLITLIFISCTRAAMYL